MKKLGPGEPHDYYDARGGVRTAKICTGSWNPSLVRDYDRVADSYTEVYFDELSRKPFDREVLDCFVRDAAGRVCDWYLRLLV